MRLFHSRPVQADTPLANLFNNYSSRFFMLGTAHTHHSSVQEYRDALTAEDSSEKDSLSERNVNDQARVFFELHLMGFALVELHDHLQKALDLLASFYSAYAGNLQAYAVANRRLQLERNGSDDETDWARDAEGHWHIRDKTDWGSLAEYSLHQELRGFFPNNGTVGEFIGSSGPEAFGVYTAYVAQQTGFSAARLAPDFFSTEDPGPPETENGQYKAGALGDTWEATLNEDLANERLANWFDAVLTLGQRIAGFYHTMRREDDVSYEWLHRHLRLLQAGEVDHLTPNPPVPISGLQ